MPDPRPLVVPLEPGRHAICCCGTTKNAPFCDGSHTGTAFRPLLEVVEESGKNFAWCTCRTSGAMPRCDGSHRKLWEDPSKPARKPDRD